VVRELVDAIEACRRGEIPDMKTEIALLRLADHLGYLPQLRAFADELPDVWRERYRRLGVEG
jgi:predicted secreted protein